VQVWDGFSLHAPAASQVRLSAAHESGSSADATTVQVPSWPASAQDRHVSVQALSQHTPSLHVSPAAHWVDVAHGAAAIPRGTQTLPWQV
jgi:hypothetical protein